MYYENINGKEKKVSKEFTDAKKFNAFANKYPMPTLSDMFGLTTPKNKALTKKTVKKNNKKPISSKKSVSKKK